MLGRTSFHIGMKLLLVIVLTEAAIMASFRFAGVDPASPWSGVADALLLGLISSLVIYTWLVRPLNQAKRQNDLFNTLVNNIDSGVVVTDPHVDGNPIIYINPAFTTITGYSSDEIIGKNPRLLQGDDADPAALHKVREAIRQQRSVRVLQRNRRKDGQPFLNDLHLNPIFGHHGQVQYWVGLINDVTAAKALEKENIRWASALQQSDEAICVFDQEGVIEFANEAFCANVRLQPEEVVGKFAQRFWSKQSLEYEVMAESLQQVQSWSGRHTRCRADLTTYEALTSITPIHDEQGTVSFVAVHRDISDMTAMEEQLRQSQKMEAIGMLVGGIAHDFNNVLAGMLGNLYLVKSKLQDSPKLYERIESVEEQGYTAAGMVRQLLSFSRKGLPDVKDVDLVPFTKDLVKFARVSVPEDIEFICDIEDQEMVTSCDPVQLQQSLLNLIVNATHAVRDKGSGKGKIELSVKLAERPEQSVYHDQRVINADEQPWVCIAVRDNGIGMDQQTCKQIFEPFFTTKPSGAGTGLGLAMVQGYVEMLNGMIDVESIPGEFTCLSIYLPLFAAGDSRQDQGVVSLRQGQGELILVADDDENVLNAMCDILESANYQVLMACNGEHAMALFKEHADKIHMAIMDMVMPKASGMQAARFILSMRKDFPITLMTGYDRDNAMRPEAAENILILRKPWDIARLNHILESSLSVKK